MFAGVDETEIGWRDGGAEGEELFESFDRGGGGDGEWYCWVEVLGLEDVSGDGRWWELTFAREQLDEDLHGFFGF